MTIYKVIVAAPKSKPSATETRLIEAKTSAAAMRFAADAWITVEKCTTAEAVELGAAGIKIERAGE